MRKIKNNEIIDLRNKSEEEKCLIMAQISKKINESFKKEKQDKK